MLGTAASFEGRLKKEWQSIFSPSKHHPASTHSVFPKDTTTHADGYMLYMYWEKNKSLLKAPFHRVQNNSFHSGQRLNVVTWWLNIHFRQKLVSFVEKTGARQRKSEM